MIKFAHLRIKDKDGHIQPHGGITYAYELNDDNRIIGYAHAKCHEKDTFNKQQGRVKAQGRLKSKRYFEACDVSKEDFFALINDY